MPSIFRYTKYILGFLFFSLSQSDYYTKKYIVIHPLYYYPLNFLLSVLNPSIIYENKFLFFSSSSLIIKHQMTTIDCTFFGFFFGCRYCLYRILYIIDEQSNDYPFNRINRCLINYYFFLCSLFGNSINAKTFNSSKKMFHYSLYIFFFRLLHSCSFY